MTDFPYEGQLIADPVTFQRATNAQVYVYDANDTTNSTPLALKDATGLPTANPLTSSADAFVKPIYAPSQDIKYVGAGLTVFVSSAKGMRDAAAASAAAAQTAADSAATAAGNTLAGASVNGAGELVLTKASGAQVPAGNVKGQKGDKGDKGDKGLDGSNVLPTDDAIEQAVKTPGTKTAAALNATYLPGDKTGALDGQVPVWDAASGKFKPKPAPSSGNVAPTLVIIGDSICASNGGPTPATNVNPGGYWQARGYWTWANTLLRQRLKIIANSGIGGQRTDQIQARFATDALAFNPGWVDIEGGTNDVSQGRTVAQITGSLQAMYDAAKAAGVRVICNTVTTQRGFAGSALTAAASTGATTITVGEVASSIAGDSLIIDTGSNAETVTVVSNSGTTITVSALTKAHASGAQVTNKTKLAVLSGVNAWIENYARNNPNVILTPLNSVYADPATGGPVASRTIDGTHPTIDGAAHLGKAKADALDRVFPFNLSSNAGGDPANLLTNGGMTGTTGTSAAFTTGSRTGNIATGWTLYAGSGAETVTASKVTRADGVPGEWQQFVISGGGTSALSFQAVNSSAGTDWSIGDKVWAEVEFQGDGDVVAPSGTGPLVDIVLNFVGKSTGSNAQAMQAASGSDGSSTLWPTDGIYRTNVAVIPTGTTSIQAQIRVNVASGTCRIGRARLIKGDL